MQSLIQVVIGAECEELLELLAQDQCIEDLSSFRKSACRGAKLLQLLGADRLILLSTNSASCRQGSSIGNPLPELSPRDFRGRGVLHQVEDRDRAIALEPGIDILQRDADIVAQTG